MNRLLLWFAYFLIVTTPIQIAFCLWIFFFLMSPDYSFFSFSTSEFMDLTFLKYLKAWIYSWLWNDFLDFIWSLPAALMSLLKLIINTCGEFSKDLTESGGDTIVTKAILLLKKKGKHSNWNLLNINYT